VRGTAADLAVRLAEPPRGEVALVLGPGTAAEPDAGEAARTVSELVAEGVPRRRAADLVARLTGVPRKRLYDLSL
jgi:16S rRNA C1402 (ribose-2'-O) methylase RsmI